MVETAVSLSLALLTLYGAFDLGLMGYLQLQLDGATFFYTHAYASGAAQTQQAGQYGQQLQSLFPNVATANMSPMPAPPPTTDMPVNYTQWGTVTDRFGGASLLRPQRLQTQATYQVAGGTWSAIFPQAVQPITLSSGNVDARPVIGNHDDDAQGADFNSQEVYNSLYDPLITDDQNVPPYYFNFGFMWQCAAGPPPGTAGSQWDTAGDTCDSMHINSLGLAEFLKDDNYYAGNRPNNGIDSGGTFELIKYHQQVYASLSLALFFFPDQPTGQQLQDWNSVPFPDAAPWGMPGYAVEQYFPNQWDVRDINGLAESNSELGRQYPLTPQNGCSWC